MKSIFNFFGIDKTKTPLQSIIEVSIYVLFGLAFFSIPTCSFKSSLYILTWIFSIACLVLMLFTIIFFYSFKINAINLSLILFCFFAFISSLLNEMRGFVITPIAAALSTAVIYSYCSANKKSRHPLFLSAFIGNILFLFIFALQYKNELLSFDFSRLGNYFGDINDIGVFMSFGVLYSFFLILFNKKWAIKIFGIIFLILFFYCGLTTGSKLFLLSFVFIVVTFVCLFFGKKKWWLSLIVLASMFALLIIMFLLPALSPFRKRILEMLSTMFGQSIDGTTSNDIGTSNRILMFFDGIEMFLRKPFFGYGIQGFFVSSSFGNGWSHNHFSEILCSFGLIGTFLFCYPYIKSLYMYFFKKNSKEKVLSISICIFFFSCMFSIALDSQKIYAYLIGICFASLCESEKNIFEIKIDLKSKKKVLILHESC